MNLHATTILAVRKGGQVVIAGDGQVTLDKIVLKANARKVRRLGDGSVIAGFAGGTADAFTLFERFELKLGEHRKNLARACVELVTGPCAGSSCASGRASTSRSESR